MYPIVQALPAEEWLQRDTITASEQRAGWFMTRQGRDFTFRGCGITPLLPPQTDDCDSDITSSVHDGQSVTNADIVLSPNPAQDVVRVSIPSPVPSGTVATIVDLLGMFRMSVDIPQGADTIILPVSGLPAGHYSVVIRLWASTTYVGGFNVQ
jgi:hypothetical protein